MAASEAAPRGLEALPSDLQRICAQYALPSAPAELASAFAGLEGALEWVLDILGPELSQADCFRALAVCALAGGNSAAMQRLRWANRAAFDEQIKRVLPGAFLALCRRGVLDGAQWVAARYSVRLAFDDALAGAAEHGRLAVVRWLAAAGAMSRRYIGYSPALWAACKNGHLAIAQFLVERYRMLPQELHDSDDLGGAPLLRAALIGGHAGVASWLLSAELRPPPEQVAAELQAVWEQGDFRLYFGCASLVAPGTALPELTELARPPRDRPPPPPG